MIRSVQLAIAAFLLIAGGAAADDSPNAVVQDAVTLLAEQLDGRKEELAENRDQLYEIIDGILLPRFDRRFAAQLVLARHWRTASPEQQQRFIEAFYQALLRKYSDGILEFDPDKITVLPFRGDTTKKRSKVRSTVDLDDGSKAAVDYELVKRKAGWLVFNVVIEGVSYVRNFRSEFDSEIKSTSLEAVIARLEGEAGIAADE
ncbi:MAG: ABC transporter substrate-binding protein [Gammaproteobacteria bacterium]|nr:ABC transporter substrate-binding protein [Gammaproteobacteria bacterium]MBT8106788.1 ABC transporter substrate-binding protein [Gammaproteobacteria bacterium]NNK25341.1 ABC transporter substrate-binding protein [Woeseiaceae bacterium]